MSVRYLFNTAGDYVAFLQGDNVFSPDTEWIGFVRNGNQLYSTDGQFKGYILEDDRVAKRKTDSPRPRVPRPPRPVRPLRPLRPLRRLRKPNLPYPYEDVFAHGIVGEEVYSLAPAGSLDELEGSELYAADNTFLGKVTRNSFDTDALANSFGTYGNPYNSASIFNEYGPYGNPYSALSPLNEFSRTPPRFVKNGRVLAYLTANQFITPRVDPTAFTAWLHG